MNEALGLPYRQVFHAIPLPALLLDAELRIVDANRAYEGSVGLRIEDMAGRDVFDVFPGDPERPGGRRDLEASMRRVLADGITDHLALMEYSVPTSVQAGSEQQWWDVVNVPVEDEQGRVVAILNTVDEVSDIVREREISRVARDEAGTLRRRTQALEADLSRRSDELVATADAERAASGRLGALAETALELAAAETVPALLEVVLGRGLRSFGADGGAVAVLDPDGTMLHLTISDSLGEEAQHGYSELPVGGPLPASVATRTGRPVLLKDRSAAWAMGPEMVRVNEVTGRAAWASLPLVAGGRVLGSLTASWEKPQQFADTDVRLLTALAAQCAQTLHRLLQRDAEREALAETRRLAEALQRSLLTEPAQPDHLQIAVRYQPAARGVEVGGDWYDAFLFEGTTSLVVADVTGHDQEAAAVMGQLRGLLRGVAHSRMEPPAAVLSGLDAAMIDLEIDRLTTVVLAQIHQGRREAEQDLRLLKWSNAGHPTPLLLHPDATAEFLERPPDLLLGLDPSTERHDHTQQLPPGATVLFYTDGLIERRGGSLAQGQAWLASTASRLVGRPLEDFCDALLGELEGHIEDDVALLALRLFSENRARPEEAGEERVPDPAPPLENAEVDENTMAGPSPSDRWPTGPASTEPPPDGEDTSSLLLPCDPAAVRQGRAFVQAFCSRVQVPEDACDTAVLLASEVVTNAVLHGRSEVRLSLSRAESGIRVEVGDANSRHPTQVAADGDALDGRGIAIVELLARDWGVRDEPPGKVVWFEVAA